MAVPSLQRVLDYFEKSPGVVSIPEIARDLGLSRGLVESMLDFWVRKGKIHRIHLADSCGGCGSRSSCQLMIRLPDGYELVAAEAAGCVKAAELPCTKTGMLLGKK